MFFLLGGGSFAFWCWVAASTPLPPGHWMQWFHPVIKFGLAILMALGIVGPLAIIYGLCELRHIRRIERAVEDDEVIPL
jgi:hypothetical protein